MKQRPLSDPLRRQLLKSAGASAALAAFPLLTRAAADSGLKIGVIGSGHVGSAIGAVWAAAGHPVMFSSENLDHDRQLASRIGAGARAGSPAEAAAFGEVLLFAVPYKALPDLGRSLAGSLKGKVVIDACNPFPNRDGAIADRALAEGAGAVSAALLPGARIVRAFNAIGAAHMGEAHTDPGHIGMPIAGDDRKAIDIASHLIREIGYEPVLVGGLAMGKYLRPGTPLAGEHPPDEIRSIVATLKP